MLAMERLISANALTETGLVPILSASVYRSVPPQDCTPGVSRKVNRATEVLSIGHSGLTLAICDGELRSNKDVVFLLRFLILIYFGKNLGFLIRIRRRSGARADRRGHIE